MMFKSDGVLVTMVRLKSYQDVQQLVTSESWMRVHGQVLVSLPESMR